MMMSSSWIRASALSPPQVQQITAGSYSFGRASPSASDLSSSSDSDRSTSSSISTSTNLYSFSSSTSSSQYTSHSHVTPPSTSRSSSSWFSYHGQSSAYISDADLFPDELVDECPLLKEAPAPPRILPMPIPASPSPAPLRPLYAPEKKSKRGKSPRKMLRPSGKRMSPIVE